MKGNFLDIIIAVLLVGAGVYAISSSIRLKREGVLFENKLLYPSNCPPENCIDVEGFITYISPKMLLFGVLCMLMGIVTMVLANITVSLTAMTFEIVAMLCVFVYIAIVQNKASKMFW